MQEFTGEIDAIALRDAIIQAIDIAVGGKKLSEDHLQIPIKFRLKETPQEPNIVPMVLQDHTETPIQKEPSTCDRINSGIQQICDEYLISYHQQKINEERERLRLAHEKLEQRAEEIRLYAEKVTKKNLQQP